MILFFACHIEKQGNFETDLLKSVVRTADLAVDTNPPRMNKIESKTVCGFGFIEKAPLDPILGTKILYKKDQDERKVFFNY